MFFKRFASLMICVLLMLAVGAGAVSETESSAVLPASLKEIRAEAFMNDGSITSVVVPEGAERIESRAFANSGLEEISLPSTLTYIADDAFAGCEDLTAFVPRNSYAHHWAYASDVNYEIIEPDMPGEISENYAVHRVEFVPAADGEPAHFLASVTAEAACTVYVDVYSDDGNKRLMHLEADAHGDSASANIRVGDDEGLALPEYYLIKAGLKRGDDVLCADYVSSRHTGAYAAIMDKTPADYPGREIVTFGDAGYGVLTDGVICVDSARAVSGGYAVGASHGIQAGDVLMIGAAGAAKPVKAASVHDNGDGTVTVMPGEITLADVYDRLVIDGYMEPENGAGAVSRSDVRIVPVKIDFSAPPVSATGKVDITIKTKVVFDKETSFFEIENWVKCSGSAETKITGALNTANLKENPFVIPLYVGKIGIPGTDLEASLTASVPLDFNLALSGKANFTVNSKIGYYYNSNDDKLEMFDERDGEAYAEVEGKVMASFGPKVELKVKLSEMLDAKVNGQIGIKAEGDLTGLKYGGSTNPGKEDSIHACDVCLDCEVFLFASAKATLNCKLNEHIKANFFDLSIVNKTYPIGYAYCSFVNDVASPYGGEIHAAFTKCENVKYRTNIAAVDYLGKAVPDTQVAVTGPYGDVHKQKAPALLYLYKGFNQAEAAFANGVVDKEIYVSDTQRDFVLTDKISLHITVREGDIPREGEEAVYQTIPGASITLTLPDGTEKKGVTGEDGTCLFDPLPSGEYTIRVTSGDRKPKKLIAEYKPDTNNGVTITFEPDMFPYLSGTTQSGYVQALTKDGNCPEYVDKVWANIKKDRWGNTDYVSLKHEDCAEEFVYSSSDVYGVSVSAANMGTDEYIYILSTYGMRSYSGNYTFILKVEDGAFRLLGKFENTDDSLDADIGISGKFTSDTKYEGTIYPSKVKFSGTKAGSGRKGHSITCTATGNTSFVENEEGYYDLVYSQNTYDATYNNDTIGNVCTEFALKKGSLVMGKQWFEKYN